MSKEANKYDMTSLQMGHNSKVISHVEAGDFLIKVNEPSQNTLNYLSANDYKLVSAVQFGDMKEGMGYDCIFRKTIEFKDLQLKMYDMLGTKTGRFDCSKDNKSSEPRSDNSMMSHAIKEYEKHGSLRPAIQRKYIFDRKCPDCLSDLVLKPDQAYRHENGDEYNYWDCTNCHTVIETTHDIMNQETIDDARVVEPK